MKQKCLNIFFVALCVALMCGCSKRRGEVEFTIFTTSDIHGKIYPVDYVTGNDRGGSMMAAATLLEELRATNENVLYFDTGDVIMGGGESYYDLTVDIANQSLMAMMLDEMECNAFVPGNHEFDFGMPTIDRFIRSGKFPVLCANMTFQGLDIANSFYQPYTVVVKNKVRIAVLGLTTMSINYKIPTQFMEGMEVVSAVESAKYWIPYIQKNEKPDVIVCLVHSGYNGGYSDDRISENEALALAEQVPGIDMIFYGHDHRMNNRKVVSCTGDSVLLLNPANNARMAGVTKLTLQFDKRKVVSKSVSAELVQLRDKEPNQELMDKTAGKRELFMGYLDSVMGVTAVDLQYSRRAYEPSTGMDYVHNILQEIVSAEITMVLPVSGKAVKAGNFTPRDAMLLYPHENTLISMMLTGGEIKAALEEGAKNIRRNPTKVVTAGGLNYTIDMSKPEGERVLISSLADGQKFDVEKMYRVTMDSYLAYALDSPFITSFNNNRDLLKERVMLSKNSDVRFNMMINHAIKYDKGKQVEPVRNGEWSLVNYN